MINMFAFSLALILLIAVNIRGQTNNFNTFPSNSIEKATLFGQFQNLIDNRNRELSSFSRSDLSQLNQDRPTSPSCFRVRPNIKNAYPTDNTKYYICRDEQRYEILTCPNGGIFDNKEKACIDLCEQKKPCLNEGQCIILSNLTLQCVCRQDWTGERCEIPLSTCANKPCGPKAECRMLKASDYSQDYVCICDNHQSYGRNCQQTVPNPCLTNLQQFHPFAFSRRAYINCDDELIFFQPCNTLLYWNQEEKRCDRSLPDLLRAPFLNLRIQNEQKQVQSNTVKPIQWQNQIPDIQTQTNQRFPTPSQPWQRSQPIPTQPLFQGQNQQSLTNTFMETTTAIPKIFHLLGFSNKNSGKQNIQWQNNPNNQQFQTQNDPSVDFPSQTMSQNFATQSQPNQLIPPPIETTTVGNKAIPQGLLIYALRGWKLNQQEPLNQIDQQKNLNSIPTFETRSWKTSS